MASHLFPGTRFAMMARCAAPLTAVAAILSVGMQIHCGGGSDSPAPPTLPAQAVAPTFSPAPGSYGTAQQVTLSDATQGAFIYYTTDGTTTPTTASSLYSGPISVSTTTTLKAMAVTSGGNPSETITGTYTILPPTDQAVAVVMTTNDKTQKLQAQTGATLTQADASSNLIYVDEAQTFQTVEGFGASFTDSAAYLLKEKASTADRNTTMTDLFTRAGQGIGLSFVRNPMGASDIARTIYSYDDGATDATLANFSLAHDLVDVVPLVQQAKALNSDLKIMANPWSPPAWMKAGATVNGTLLLPSMNGGSLLTDAATRTAFANYFVKYIQGYAAQSIPIDYISLQNEPLYDTVNAHYPGMYMDAPTQLAILKDYVLPALTSNSLNTKVLVYDHNWDGYAFPQTVLSDATIQASPLVAGTAWHGYGGTAGAMTALQTQFPAKGQYMTEHSGGTWVKDGNNVSIQVQSDFEEIIHVMRNWGKAYVKWSLALDQNRGPFIAGGCGTCTPLVTVNSSTGAVTYEIEYYTMGHFSKYVLPGAKRIYSSNAPGFVSAAFLNPDKSKALVVYNETTASRVFHVQWGVQSFAYALPGRAGATFTWSGSQDGSYTLDAKAQIQASSYTSVAGLQTEGSSDTDGGFDLGYAASNSYAVYKDVLFEPSAAKGLVTKVDARAANNSGNPVTVSFYLDHDPAHGGTLAATVTVPNTGGWQSWQTLTADVSSVTGVHDVYVVFGGSTNLNWFQFR